MTTNNTFTEKDLVVCRGLGLGRVKKINEDKSYEIRLEDDNDTATIEAANVPALLRPLVSRDQAEKILSILMRKEGAPDPRSWGQQYIELQRVLKAGDPEQQAVRLQGLYRCSYPLKDTHERVLSNYEEALLPELAHVLKTKTGSLKAKLHRNQPAFGYIAPDRPDDGPPPEPKPLPEGWSFESAFRLYSGKLAVGEYPVSETDQREYGDGRRHTVVSTARNGAWFGFHRETEDEDHEWEYAIVHEGVVQKTNALLASAVALGEVNVEGGTIHVVDSEVRDDRTWMRSLESGEPRGRAFICNTGGDGGFEVRGLKENGELVLLLIPC